MKLVALLRAPADPAPVVKMLCDHAGFAPAEARMRLAGEPPFVLSRLQAAPADALCAELGKLGLAALAIPTPAPGDDQRLMVRSMEFQADAVLFTGRLGPPHRVPYASITAILRGLVVSRESSERTESKRVFSLGKALLTQGLSITTTEKKTVKYVTDTPDQFVLVYCAEQPAILYESEVGFACLGADVQPSRLLNLQLVDDRLRKLAPQAFHDDRLLRMARRSGPFEGGQAQDALAEILHQAVARGLLG